MYDQVGIFKTFAVVLTFLRAVNTSGVDCSKPPQILDPLTCCRLPELMTEQVKQKCRQFATNETTLFPTGSACFIECLNNKTALFDDDYNINEYNVREFLGAAMKDATDMIPIALQSFKTCGTKMAAVKMNTTEMNARRQLDDAQCCPKREIFMSCVMEDAFNNCPNSLRHDSAACNDAREYLKAC